MHLNCKRGKYRTMRALSFHQWIKQFANDDNELGDLVTDILNDSDFPRGRTSIRKMQNHLTLMGACKEAKQALKTLWTQYKDYLATLPKNPVKRPDPVWLRRR